MIAQEAGGLGGVGGAIGGLLVNLNSAVLVPITVPLAIVCFTLLCLFFMAGQVLGTSIKLGKAGQVLFGVFLASSASAWVEMAYGAGAGV